MPTGRSPTRCSCTACSTTRAGIASSTTATTSTRRSRSTWAWTPARSSCGCETATRTSRYDQRRARDARPDGVAGTPTRAGCCASTSLRPLLGARDRALIGDHDAVQPAAVAGGRRRAGRGARRALRERRLPRRGAGGLDPRGAVDMCRSRTRACAGVRARTARRRRRGGAATGSSGRPQAAQPARARARAPAGHAAPRDGHGDPAADRRGSRWTQIADELAARDATPTSSCCGGRQTIPPCRSPRGDPRARPQGRRELLEIAELATRMPRGKLQGAIALALEAMAAVADAPAPHDWSDHRWARAARPRDARDMAADEDLAPARRALSDELDLGLDADATSSARCRGARPCGVHGPFDELQRATSRCPTPTADATRRGTGGVRSHFRRRRRRRVLGTAGPHARLAATHVERRVRLAAQRLAELAATARSASVRRRRERCGGGQRGVSPSERPYAPT